MSRSTFSVVISGDFGGGGEGGGQIFVSYAVMVY